MKKEYRNVAKTKNTIRQAFSELLGEKKNIGSITIGEIVQRANIARSTFYNHYVDVYAVAEEFENELIENLSAVLDEIEYDKTTEYELYIKKIIEFLRENEESYRMVIGASDIRYFIDKLKAIISKKIFERNETLPFPVDKEERYVQIRILTNACVDTVVDYYKGTFKMSLDEIGIEIIKFINRLK